jgi:phage terminase large subunit GpA-like protein
VPLYLLQTDALKDQVNNALWRESPGPNYVHFPKWLGSWFYDELTYEERSPDGKWSKPGRGANEAFDLLVYADALAILHGYEKSNGRMRLSGHGGKRGWRAPPETGEAPPRLLHRPLPETRKHGKAP